MKVVGILKSKDYMSGQFGLLLDYIPEKIEFWILSVDHIVQDLKTGYKVDARGLYFVPLYNTKTVPYLVNHTIYPELPNPHLYSQVFREYQGKEVWKKIKPKDQGLSLIKVSEKIGYLLKNEPRWEYTKVSGKGKDLIFGNDIDISDGYFIESPRYPSFSDLLSLKIYFLENKLYDNI